MTDCDQWERLSDRLVVGESITPAQQAFMAQHETECPSCAREAAAYRELKPAVLHSVPSEDEIERVLRQLSGSEAPASTSTSGAFTSSPGAASSSRGEHERRAAEAATLSAIAAPAGRQQRRVMAAGAAMVGLCAALALIFARPQPPSPSRASVATSPSAAPAGTQPWQPLRPVTPSRESARSGEDSCGELTNGVTLCTTRGSEVDRVELNGPERVIYLHTGRAVASVARQSSVASFRVETPGGSVTATDAVFSVEVGESGTTARVSRGAVLLRLNESDTARPLLAGQMLRLGAPESSRLPAAEASEDRSLLERLGRLPSDRQ